MAINFPNAPIVGQVVTIGLNNYAWNGTAWQIPQSAGAGGGGTTVTTDDTAPTGAVDGQLWFKSSTGGFYVWYDDGNTQQWVQVSASGQMVDQNYVRKVARRSNLVINGALNVSQENQNTEGTTNSYYAADQWMTDVVAATAAYGFARIVNANVSGSQCRLRFRVTTAKASLAAGDYANIQTRLEGLNTQDLGWGGTAPKDAVLQFGFNGPAGTYAIAIRNGPSTASFLASFTITAGQALTDTLQTIKIPAPALAVVWPVDNSMAVIISITLAIGTTYAAPATGWNSGNFIGVTGMSNGLAAVQSFQIWDIGLYADPDKTGLAPVFEVSDYSIELAKCERYWEKQNFYIAGYHVAANQIVGLVFHKAAMRTTPTIIYSVNGYGNSSGIATIGANDANVLGLGVTVTGTGGATVQGTAFSSARM